VTLTLSETGTNSIGPVSVGRGDTFTIAGPIGGDQTLNMQGAGTLVLTGSNTHIGGTTVGSGTLGISSLVNIGAGPLTLSGGTLNATGNLAFTTAPMITASSSIETNAGFKTELTGVVTGSNGVTLTLGGAGTNSIGPVSVGRGDTFTIVGPIGGEQTLNMQGAGTLRLMGTNTYKGGTTLTSGTLSISSADNIGSGVVTLSKATTLRTTDNVTSSNPFSIIGNAAITSSGITTLTGVITGSDGVTLTLSETGTNSIGPVSVGRGDTFTIAGPIGGEQILNLQGAGTLRLMGTNTYKGGTTLTSGTLQISSAENLGTGALTLDGGTLQVDTLASGNTTTLSGVISGTGTLAKINPGLLVLSGTNSGSWNTTIHEGTLQISSGENLATGLLTLNGGTLQVDTLASANTTTLSGVISGTGTLAKINPGLLVLSGTNSGSWHTTIHEGTLQISSAENLGTGTLTLNGGTLQVDTLATGNTTTLSGVISGTGTLAKINPGLLVLSGTNSGSWNTTIHEGTLQISSAENLGTGALTLNGGTLTATDAGTISNPFFIIGKGAINSSGTTTLTGLITGSDGKPLTLSETETNSICPVFVDSNSTFTIAGPIIGTQGLNKQGSGTLVVTGSNTYTGRTTVSKGQFAVIGSITSPISVVKGAILSGTGTIYGEVNNTGTLSLGASIGTLTVKGKYTQADGSFYLNEINPTSSGQLNVQSNVIIGKDTTFTMVPEVKPASYPNGKTYVVIDASGFGTVSGTFKNFVTTAPLITGFLDYSHAGQVILTLEVNSVASFSAIGNAGAVASAIDAIGGITDPQVDGVINTLIPLNEQDLTNALDQMHPALYRGAAIVQENNAIQVRGALSERLYMTQNGQCDVSQEVNSREKKPHFWLTGVGDFLHQNDAVSFDSPQVGYRSNNSGFVAGIDYPFFHRFTIGVLGAYTHSNIQWNRNRGNGNIDSGYAGCYLSAVGKLFYANFSIVGDWSEYESQRTIVYPSVNETAKNSHHGKQLLSHIDMGLNFSAKKLIIRPFDSFDWIVQKQGGFSETGAGEYDLAVEKTKAMMVRNELGLKFATSLCMKGSKASFDAKLGWIREVRINGENTRSLFEGSIIPVSFTVTGYFPSRSLLSFGANITAVTFKDRLTCSAYYNGAIGENYCDHGIGGQICLGF
jgi:autotransporter-associated beta strand protein